MNNLKTVFKSKWLILIAVTAIVSLAALGAVIFIQKNDQPEDLFAGFSKLVLSAANAQDNFVLTPTKIDSLGVAPDTTYLLASKEPLESDAVQDNLKIDPDIKYDFKEISDTEWEIVPQDKVEPNDFFKIVIAASYVTEEGQQKEYDYSWAYQVKDVFKVIHSIPRDAGTSVPLDSGVEVTFSHDNFKDFDKYFEITPRVDGNFEMHGRTAVFVPKINLEAGKIYTVKVKTGLPVNGSEEKLNEDYVFAFETEDNDSQYNNNTWLSLNDAFIETSSSDQPILQIYAKNISGNRLNAKVYKFANWQKYVESVKKRDNYPWWSMSKEKYLEDTSALSRVLEIDLDILTEDNTQYLQFPEAFQKGDYLIELAGPQGPVQAWLQVSDLATFYTITQTDTIFWVNSPATKKPVNNAQINIIDTGYTYQTGSDGVARFELPAEISARQADPKRNQRDYFRISLGDDSLILPTSQLSYYYSWDYGNANDDYWNYLYSDRPLYQTTDKIQFWGMLKDRDNQPITEKVTVTLYKEGYVDYYYRPIMIAEQIVNLSQDDTFLGEIDIQNLRPDYYTLELKVGDKVVRNRSISIKPYTKPAYSLSLTPDRKNLYADETANLKVKASFFEGTPVPNLDLVFNMPEGDYKFTTNEKGEADLTYRLGYTPCQRDYSCWPDYIYLSIQPQNSELAEISAAVSLNFYGPKVYETHEIEYPQAGLAKINFTTKFIDFSALENQDWWSRNTGDKPAPNTKIEGELIKITYNKVEIGTGYDFINKRRYSKYRYDTVESVDEKISFSTDSGGNYTYQKQLSPNTSYRLKYKIYDADGKYDIDTIYLYYYDGYHTWQYSGSEYKYYRLELAEDKTFSIGEKVETIFMENDNDMPDAPNAYLYLQYQAGLQEYSVSGSHKYSFNFKAEDVPNVAIQGVYFNGLSYTKTYARDIAYKAEDKKLKISITSDKSLYEPGEEMSLGLFVRDKNDRPVSAEVNVNLVDEAFYAVMDETVDPLSVIYGSIGAGIISSRSSHDSAQDAYGMDGAEKGGCFLPGTQIAMADGSQKPIEEIAVGDWVKTFSDPITRVQDTGQVSQVWEHTVAEYYIINDKLRVTGVHMIYANGRFMDVASLKIGDWLLDSSGNRVYIQSITKEYRLTKVYNFAVEPQHTYFADGFYVHNEKGGGPRELFVDTAIFDTVKTNQQGRASLKMTLPDNITSWRVTAQAVSGNIEVGDATQKIPVSLPVFAEVTIGNEYLAADAPVARLRAYGNALNSSDRVNFSLQASSLGVDQSDTQTAAAFESVYFALPKLSVGKHNLTYNLESAKGDDAILLPINVIESRLQAQVAKSEKLTLESQIVPVGDLPIAVILTDQGQNKLYGPLTRLSWSYGDRIDQVLPQKMARDLLVKYYGRDFQNNTFDAFDYQTTQGGITLLPYSSEDLELSARVASTDAQNFDQESLAQYFFKILENRQSNPEEISYALAGLAALEKPVLPRISSWLNSGNTSVKEKLYLAQAIYDLGSKQWSKDIYLQIMNEYAVIKDPEISLHVSENYDEVFQATALAAVLATSLEADQAEGLWLFLINNQKLYGEHKNSENLFSLEKINYIQHTIAHLKPSPARVKYILYGQENTVDITGGSHHSFQIYPQDVDKLKFLEITGDVGLTASYTQPIQSSDIVRDPSISIRREYYVDGVKTTTFKETDNIEVRLYVNISAQALSGRYQVTDILPSGLEAVTKEYTWGSGEGCNYRYPYDSFGQTVKYNIDKNWRNLSCQTDYFKYFARVKNKGTYLAEPAIIQSFVNPEFINYSDQTTITIK